MAGTLAAAAPIARRRSIAPNLHEVDDDDAAIYQGRSVEQLEDMDVARDGETLGEIEEVLANADDQIVAVVIEYDDGLLDLNERDDPPDRSASVRC